LIAAMNGWRKNCRQWVPISSARGVIEGADTFS
jgi:hypothetical protein